MAARTYSSIREALASGILDQPPPPQQASASNNGPGRPTMAGRRAASSTAVRTGASLLRSFTAGSSALNITGASVVEERRPSFQPDRRRLTDSLGSIVEEDEHSPILAIREIALAADETDGDEETLDLSEMSSDDLERLKRDDPFAYYSIPAVHRRIYHCEEVSELSSSFQDLLREGEDAADNAAGGANDRGNGDRRASLARKRRSRMSASMPAGMLADADMARALLRGRDDDDDEGQNHGDSSGSLLLSKRRRRLSCEAHSSYVCEEWLGDLMGTVDGDDGANDEDEADAEEDRLLRLSVANDDGDGWDEADWREDWSGRSG